ncbi:MAG TPA: hypothetical protein ENH89_13500 [Aurantimonas coralicida]|uniref:Uncharacterized protein n=1 Tax=Aurantimonas coralicida TaxID=182270 RepID=A0A9C9NH83_9HYPH|nr:hypothetical protein [Aurantimonas coralicida]
MPFNFRLNLQSVFRRLGIQSGARLPQLDDNVQMTMQVTDLSRLIPAPIEPRGLCSINLLPIPGLFGVVQLKALSAGGVFIEQIFLRAAAPGPFENYQLNVNTNDLALPLAVNIDVGGLRILSRFTGGSLAAVPIGVLLPSPPNSAINFPVGIFVPNQSFFTLRNYDINQHLDVAMVYRELPSVEEVG